MTRTVFAQLLSRPHAESVEVAACGVDDVVDQLVGSGLQLARTARDPSVAIDVRAGLRDVIDNLDRALSGLRSASVALSCVDSQCSQRCIAGRTAVVHEASSVAASPAPRTTNGRVLRRVGEQEVFAYAPHDARFFRAATHALWAQERDGLLRASRSGATLAVRVGDVYYHPESNAPLYVEGP